ncbi:transcription intermediary factor 1-alpha-like isoform X1 [Branchiostoma floridae]|uniref:Transcription intermediary factor 1-alpha-like isoform X1 n=1 Tax=Branchiostoma floridae TaxID=7739 RepID=A0A9J7HDU0_BRAFL|nr:transcription intermediary factor 1-alpha-like isoform X1 [Branchiostoma floridae]
MDYCHGEFSFARCRLCGDPVNNPRILCCWHVFCQECIMGYNVEEQFVKCPSCKEITVLPLEGIPGLQHRARGFLSRIGSQSPKISEFTNDVYLRHYCPHRAKQVQEFRKCFVPATRRCIECDEYLCSHCSPQHLLEMHQAPPSVCKQHDKAEDFYCEDCNTVTCLRCASTVHIHHDTWEIDEVADGFREVMQYWLDQWRQGRWQIEEDLENSIQEINAQIQIQSDRILDEIIEVLRQREQDLLNQVDRFARDMWTRFQEEKSKIKSSSEFSHLKPLCDFSENLVRFGTDREVIALHREMTQQLECAISEIEPTEVSDDLHSEIFFVPQKLPSVADWIQIGAVSISGPDSDGLSRRMSRDSGQGSRSSSELSLISLGLARRQSRDSDVMPHRSNQLRPVGDYVSKSSEDVRVLTTTEESPNRPLLDEEYSIEDQEEAKTSWQRLKHKIWKHGHETTEKLKRSSSPFHVTETGKKLSQHPETEEELSGPEENAGKTEEGVKRVVQSARRGSTYQRVVVPTVQKGEQQQHSDVAEPEHFDWRRSRSRTFDLGIAASDATNRHDDTQYKMDPNPHTFDELTAKLSADNITTKEHFNWRKQRSQSLDSESGSPKTDKRDSRRHFQWRNKRAHTVLTKVPEKQRVLSPKGQHTKHAWQAERRRSFTD